MASESCNRAEIGRLMNRSPLQTDKEDACDVFGRWAWLLVMLGLAICCAAAFLSGCTIRPKVVHNNQASFDGNLQNSGLLGNDSQGNAIITAHARDRYNALVDDYGKFFSPPLNRDDGIMPTATNTFLIDGEHLFFFATMNRWLHSSPEGPPRPK